MARFLFWSDLHLEFAPFKIPQPGKDAPGADEIDAILIAGDTDVKARHVDFAKSVWDIWNRPVIMVDGNHEPYGSKRIQKLWQIEDERLALARRHGADIEILRGTSRIVGDTRIIGATLWTDLRLFPDLAAGVAIRVAADMNDYACIHFEDSIRGIYRRLIPSDTVAMHAAQKDAIYRHLAQPFDGRTIVMTHHLPVRQMLRLDRAGSLDLLDAAFASDLAHEICGYDIDAWICGHSHRSVEAIIPGASGPIRFLRNIRGYPWETTDFDPVRVLDSAAPRLRREMDEAPSP